MSDDEQMTTAPDELSELGKQLPWHRPDAARRESVRSNLLSAAAERAAASPPRRWPLVACGFAAGALAAAAIAVLVIRSQPVAPTPASYAQIEASTGAELAHTRTPTATGTDETVRIKSGTLRLAVPAVRTGDHVRVQTADAAVEGTGSYEVVVVHDALASVTVAAGTASVTVKGQEHAVFLAAGETWRAPVITADLGVPAITSTTVAAPEVATPSAVRQSSDATDPAVPAPHDTATPAIAITGSPRAVVTPPQDAAPSAIANTRTPHVVVTAPREAATPRALPTSASPDSAVATPRDSATTSAATRTEPAHPAVTAPSNTATESAATNTETARPAVTAPSNTATTPAITAAQTPRPSLPSGPTATERHFQAGTALLRAGKAADAAIELGAAADAGTDALALDARYFQAVALAKAGHKPQAEAALIAFLDHAPTSIRRGRAAVMLARLLLDRGDRASARAWFEAASKDGDPSVAAAGRAGLSAL